MAYQILKVTSVDGYTFTLTKSSSLGYFSKSGKARLKMDVKYSVSLELEPEIANVCPASIQSKQRFHLTSKSEALRYFNSLKKGN